ncbi:MAG: putative ribosomal N-acetyltransferase YdaF [Phycisphaerae bacterium]|nr:putative ribosomal N-acetyltransferase YdaF [Phycisphaerae bacterium]
MSSQPILRTARLVLRPFTMEDGPRVRELAGDQRIAETTLHIPHPYPDGAAEEWIAKHQEAFDAGRMAVFAVTLSETGELIGSIGLEIRRQHNHAEMGYWIGADYWGRGYCTEAARAVVDYAFDELGLVRVHAHYLARNPASGRVMQKLGMRHEGTLRSHVLKNGRYEDCEVYGLLREERVGGHP